MRRIKLKLILFFCLALTAFLTTFAFHEFNEAGIVYSKGHRYFKQSMYADAMPYLIKAVSMRGNFKNALRELGQSALWTGNFDIAKSSFEALLKINPNNRFAKRGMADLLSWTGRRPEAIAIYNDMLKRYPSDIDTMRSLADAFYWEKDYPAAIPLYKKFLLAFPSDEEAVVNYADCLAQTGDAESAENAIAKLSGSGHEYSSAVGRYYLRRANFSEAEKNYRQALISKPDDLNALTGLCDSLAGQKKFKEAVDILNDAISRSPRESALKLIRANYTLWAGDFTGAQKLYEDFLKEYPNDPSAEAGLARSFAWRGQYKDALPLLEKLFAEGGDLAISKDLALAYLSTGKKAEAAKLYGTILAQAVPETADLIGAARAFAANGEDEKAVNLAKEVLAQDENNKTAYEILADVAIREGKFAVAEDYLRKAIRVGGARSYLIEKLGDVLMWQGKFVEAEKEYKRIVK